MCKSEVLDGEEEKFLRRKVDGGSQQWKKVFYRAVKNTFRQNYYYARMQHSRRIEGRLLLQPQVFYH